MKASHLFFYCDISKKFWSDVVESHFFDAANSVHSLQPNSVVSVANVLFEWMHLLSERTEWNHFMN